MEELLRRSLEWLKTAHAMFSHKDTSILLGMTELGSFIEEGQSVLVRELSDMKELEGAERVLKKDSSSSEPYTHRSNERQFY